MCEFILIMQQIKLGTTQTCITLFVYVHLKGVPSWDHNPNAEIKLTAVHNQPWSFNIFLDDPNLWLLHMSLAVLIDLVVILDKFDFPASWKTTWLNNPNILTAVQVILTTALWQSNKDVLYLLREVLDSSRCNFVPILLFDVPLHRLRCLTIIMSFL